MAEFPIPNFVETLSRAKTLGFKDNRDRIYTFLGSPKALVGEKKEIVLVPDYEKDYREVYRDFAISWLTKTNDLRLLSAVEHMEPTLQAAEPSWVPRWDVTLSTNYYGLFSPGFNASRDLPETDPEISTGGQLRVTGFAFDTIFWQSSMLLKNSDWEVPKAGNVTALTAAWQAIAQHDISPSSMPHVLSLTKTLCREAYGEDATKVHPDEAAFALAPCRQSSSFGDATEADLE